MGPLKRDDGSLAICNVEKANLMNAYFSLILFPKIFRTSESHMYHLWYAQIEGNFTHRHDHSPKSVVSGFQCCLGLIF